MALSDDLRDLTSRSLAALDESHDYFTFSRRLWRQLYRDVRESGRRFTFRNLVTGTKVNEEALAQRAQLYVADYLVSFTFQHFVSVFEDFFFDLLRHWLVAFPASLSRKQVDMGTVLNAPDKTTLIMAVVDKELNELKYERVADWFSHLERLTNITTASPADIESLAEMKASRDILVHNKGIVNRTYLAKAGSRARYREGDRLKISAPYHNQSYETIKTVVSDLSRSLTKKARST